MKKKAIIVFGKFPKPGNVKTRLAKTIGDKKAVEFYKNCTGVLFAELKKLSKSVDIFFFHSPNDQFEEIKSWVPDFFIVKSPKRIDLVDQNADAFEEVFSRGFENVVIITSDVPDLTTEILTEAFNLLKRYDGVVGPDNDGGIYLYGINKFDKAIFDITYGKGTGFCEQLVNNFKNLKFNTKVLKPLIDVDTYEDLMKWLLQDSSASHPAASLEFPRR